ncbi:MAG: hypothetical protein ACFFEY_03685 [Candidatus Thorarchaeota archaeon]
MEINSINKEPNLHYNHKTIKCGICHTELQRGASIYQEGLSFGIVCEKCYKSNSSEDLELMANLFLAYGGYFGMKKRSEFSLYKEIKKLTSKIQPGKTSDNLINLNIKMLHRALLHGVTPQEVILGLKVLID